MKTTRFWGVLSKRLRSLKVDLLPFVMESSEKAILGLLVF